MNMQQIMQQAQRMQREITKKKEILDASIFAGKSEWIELEIKNYQVSEKKMPKEWLCQH